MATARRKNKNLRNKTKRQAQTFNEYEKDIPYLKTDGIILYSPPEPEKGKKRSTATLDFLMYEVTEDHNPMEEAGQLWYERTFFVHTNVGPDEVKVLCPKRSLNKRCPICEHQAVLKKKGADKEDIKALYPRKRQLFCLIDADDDKEEIQVWDISTYLFGELLMEEISENEDYSIFADLEEGLSINVKFKQESIGSNVTFMRAVELDFEERPEFDDSIIDDCPNLDTLLVEMPYDKMEELFFCVSEGGDEEEDEEDDDDGDVEEPPSKRRSRRGRAVKEEEEEEEDEEETPKPRGRRERRSTSRRANKQDEEEDGDEEEAPKRSPRSRRAVEEEEEEEEAPKRSRRSRRPVEQEVGEDEDDEEEAPTAKKKRATKSEELECPVGAIFGKDNGEYEECEDCEIYTQCFKASRKR